MEIKYSDALLIQSIFHTEQENKGARLTDIIAYADYVDHAILTFEEFKESLNKLLSLNLITGKTDFFATTVTFKEWWNLKFANRKRIYVQKELELIQSYLEKASKASRNFSNGIPPEIVLSE